MATPALPRGVCPGTQSVSELADSLWQDSIQSGEDTPTCRSHCTGKYGFHEYLCQHPVCYAPDDSTESGWAPDCTRDCETGEVDGYDVGVTRVADPACAGGYALRHFCHFDDTTCRSQVGLFSRENDDFAEAIRSPGGIYLAMDWYLPGKPEDYTSVRKRALWLARG